MTVLRIALGALAARPLFGQCDDLNYRIATHPGRDGYSELISNRLWTGFRRFRDPGIPMLRLIIVSFVILTTAGITRSAPENGPP